MVREEDTAWEEAAEMTACPETTGILPALQLADSFGGCPATWLRWCSDYETFKFQS